MRFRSSDLKPGRYSLHTTIQSKTDRNHGSLDKRGDYITALNVNYGKGVIDGGFYQNSDTSQYINRIVANGTDQYLELFGRRLYRDTEVVMNGTVILSRSQSNDDPNSLNDGQQIKFKVPAAVAKRFAGKINTIQLRTRDLSGDGTGFILSDPQTLFIVAGKPTLTKSVYQSVDNAPLPLGSLPVTFEVNGANLSQATTLQALWKRDGVATATDLPAGYASPTALRATLSSEFLADFHSHSSDGKISVQATTPFSFVAPDYNSPATTSGGTSTPLAVTLVHLAPTIERLEPAILVRQGGEQTIKLYGQNLLRDPSPYYAFGLVDAIRGAKSVAFSAGTDLAAPYLLVTFKADGSLMTDGGLGEAQVRYRDVASAVKTFNVENGVPSIDTATTYRAIMGPKGDDLKVGGAPFYANATTALLNGTAIGVRGVDSITSMKVSIPANFTGATAKLKLRNPAPGGGDSNEVDVTLLEGDASTVKVVPGAVVFDRASNTYRQSFAVTYVGTHDVSRGARIAFDLPNAVTLQNSAGLVDGKPYLNAALVPRRQTTVVAVWKRSASGTVDFPRSVSFPY